MTDPPAGPATIVLVALDQAFGFGDLPQSAHTYLRGATVSLATFEGPVEVFTYSAHQARDGTFVLSCDRECEVVADAAPDLVSHLLWHVNRRVCFHTTSHLMVHAGVVEHGGRALLLPAPQESGKTTLTTGLLRAGLRYLTDEAAAIHPDTGLVHPYPKWLSIDRGSWPLFPELAPNLPADLAPFAAEQWHVDPEAVRPGIVVTEPVPPAWVITPRYEAGAATTLEPITRAEALTTLAEQAFTLDRWGQQGLDVLARLVRGCDCYRLVTGSLDEAVSAVLDVLDAPGADAHRPR